MVSPVQAIKQVLEKKMDQFARQNFAVAAGPGEDLDRGVYCWRFGNNVAKGWMEIDEGGNGYLEIIHQPSGRPILREFVEGYSATRARATAEHFSRYLLGARAEIAPAELPIQIRFYDWLRRNFKDLPRSPWVHAGSMSHPETKNFSKKPPQTVTTHFEHYVSRQTILLTVNQDGYALIEKQETRFSPVVLIQKTPVAAEEDFAPLYAQALTLAVGSGPTPGH